MIVVLKGANFASDNIGQVEIPRELDAFTVEFLTHYTKTLTNDQKYAVDDFLTSMRTSGIWDKLSMIFFPMLAASLEEAFYNPTGMSTAPSSYKGYGLSNGGLVIDMTNGYITGDDFDGGHPVLTSNTIDVPTQGFHYAMLATGNQTYDNMKGSKMVGSNVPQAYPSLSAGNAKLYTNKADLQFLLEEKPTIKALSLHMAVLEAPTGGNISDDKTFLMAAGTFASVKNSFVSESVTATNAMVYNKLQPLSNGEMSSYTTNLNTYDTAYLWSVGKALTKQEALLYHQYCEALKTAFGLS